MKFNKMVTLDSEIITKLSKEENASALINSLLVKHYEGESLSKLSKEQLEELLKLEEIKEEADKKQKEIVDG